MSPFAAQGEQGKPFEAQGKSAGHTTIMFERFTEKARRVVFFARYEASQYGSPRIEGEHLLLGLIREDPALLRRFEGTPTIGEDLRGEIERQISRRKPFSTSIELPLSDECKKALTFAAKEADRLGQPHVETAHLLLGLIRVDGSVVSALLTARGLKAEIIREQLARATSATNTERTTEARRTLDAFLAGLKCCNSGLLISFFAENAAFIDVSGRRWNREEIGRAFESLFAPYAKKNASYVVEGILANGAALFVATILWKNALLASEQRAWSHRMSLVLVPGARSWEILLAQVTVVQS